MTSFKLKQNMYGGGFNYKKILNHKCGLLSKYSIEKSCREIRSEKELRKSIAKPHCLIQKRKIKLVKQAKTTVFENWNSFSK